MTGFSLLSSGTYPACGRGRVSEIFQELVQKHHGELDGDRILISLKAISHRARDDVLGTPCHACVLATKLFLIKQQEVVDYSFAINVLQIIDNRSHKTCTTISIASRSGAPNLADAIFFCEIGCTAERNLCL